MIEKPNPRNFQEHFRNDVYARYHKDIYMPPNIVRGALAFLPPVGTILNLSQHYVETREERNLPKLIRMPPTYDVIDVTIIRDTWAVWRIMIRTPWFWSKGKRAKHDLCIVLEGDYEVVTSYWVGKNDQHTTLDPENYERIT